MDDGFTNLSAVPLIAHLRAKGQVSMSRKSKSSNPFGEIRIDKVRRAPQKGNYLANVTVTWSPPDGHVVKLDDPRSRSTAVIVAKSVQMEGKLFNWNDTGMMVFACKAFRGVPLEIRNAIANKAKDILDSLVGGDAPVDDQVEVDVADDVDGGEDELAEITDEGRELIDANAS
jgi:hypothetical protein